VDGDARERLPGLAVTIDDVRQVASGLPRSYEVVVRGRVKFRVGQIVFLAFSRDENEMGFGFPKEEREAFVSAYPEKFFMPGPADLRYHWIEAHMSALDRDEMRELVLDAWAMVVPKSVAEAYFGTILPGGEGGDPGGAWDDDPDGG
jgi:hypothetical protein